MTSRAPPFLTLIFDEESLYDVVSFLAETANVKELQI